MKTYLICVKSEYVRDTQIFDPGKYSDFELSDIDIHSESECDRWRDADVSPFVDIIQAPDERTACAVAAKRSRYDERILVASDISKCYSPDEMHERVTCGYLKATVCPDPDYPGIDVEYIADNDKGEELSRPRVLIEYPIDGDLRALIWNDPTDEDYTKEIVFPSGNKIQPRKVRFRNLLEENGDDIQTGILLGDGTLACQCGCNGIFEEGDYEIIAEIQRETEEESKCKEDNH